MRAAWTFTVITDKQISIRRGKTWGERLRQELTGFSGDTMEWMEQRTQLLKSDTHSRVGLMELDQQPCYLKYYQSKSIGQRALFQLGIGRGFRSFDGAMSLKEKRVLVPEPLSCVLVPGGMMLLTCAIEPARDLKAEWLAGAEPDLQSTLMEQAGHALTGLHMAGYCHGDCKWSNFLWSQGQCYLVDLEAVEQVTNGGAGACNKRARDLARFVLNAEDLSVSDQEFEPFLQVYLEHNPMSRTELIATIIPALDRLRRRHELRYGVRGRRLLGGQ